MFFETLGYIVAGILVPAIIGAALVIYFRDGRKVKSISLKPWSIHAEFDE